MLEQSVNSGNEVGDVQRASLIPQPNSSSAWGLGALFARLVGLPRYSSALERHVEPSAVRKPSELGSEQPIHVYQHHGTGYKGGSELCELRKYLIYRPPNYKS
jgi:hypothetical protein